VSITFNFRFWESKKYEKKRGTDYFFTGDIWQLIYRKCFKGKVHAINKSCELEKKKRSNVEV
jgi:hypothetical protein